MVKNTQCCQPAEPVLTFEPVRVAEHIESCRAHAANLSGLAHMATQALHTCIEYGPDEPHLGTRMDGVLELLDQVHAALLPLGVVSHEMDPGTRAMEIAADCEAQRQLLNRARHLTLAVVYVLRSSEMDGTDEADEIIESLQELEEGIRLVFDGLLPAAMSEATAQSAAVPESHAARGKIAEIIQNETALCYSQYRCAGAAGFIGQAELARESGRMPSLCAMPPRNKGMIPEQNGYSAQGASGAQGLGLTGALASLYGRLLAAGVTKLTARYEIEVGTGQVQWNARNAFGQTVTSQIDGELTKDLVSFVLLLLERRYPNWTTGTGAYGRVDWNLRRNDLLHNHARCTAPITMTKHRGLADACKSGTHS